MIPFGMLKLRLCVQGKTIPEVSVLEPAPDRITFRLPHSLQLPEGADVRVELRFFGLSGEEAAHVEQDGLRAVTIRNDRYWTVYAVAISQPEYRRAVLRLNREYMGLIETGLDGETIRYEESDFVPSALPEGVVWERGVLPEHELGLQLRTRRQLDLFLELPAEAVPEAYGGLMGIAGHPLLSSPLTAVYIGSGDCPLRFPDTEVALQLLRRATSQGIETVFMSPPLSEGALDPFLSRLTELSGRMEAEGLHAVLEVNDPGLLGYYRPMSVSVLRCIEGTTAYRRLRDPRGGMEERSPDRSEEAIYLPYYRMNLGTFCPLYACIVHGDRGRQHRVDSCPGYCEERCFIYPRQLDMVGRENALYGMDRSLLEIGRIAELLRREGLRRVVLDL